ncbi:MAG: hypothetical protein K0R64_2725 [Novosphingobium lindaniclasticum]|jgi:uncharacterized membrane protein|uniref:Uncharacterized protein n=1 Tax=Novosphingobium lindaniclasticum LE124 TaxID=1096930 RepID=T0IW80_9SPHN|nr:hypothetical protein [Novosphingobium lindaniclasticum]EQB13954.1 hypothetical protein L284_13505 [Novosphingobium lindaniclasticum LE124]MDF2639741.1 hypothetical protein [Novosphingobium lindaniclasticum]
MDIALSLMTLTIVALVLGAIALFRRGGSRKQAWLMLVLAGVLIVNVGIWTLPNSDGESLARAGDTKEAPE